jgi:hypothetical protein
MFNVPEKVAFDALDFISAGLKALLVIAKQHAANAAKRDLVIEFMQIKL